MNSLNKQQLYIHFPFCERKCEYCDFLSFPFEENAYQQYIEALKAEIRGISDADAKVATVFFGGGTPSLIKNQDMQDIFAVLHQHFDMSEVAEITIEVNPGSANVAAMQLWYQLGVNRLSIGLQSSDDEELRMLGRVHSYQDFLQTYHEAQAAGFQNINVDLISGIPGQSLAAYQKTLERVLALRPQHISAYSLIVEVGTAFGDYYLEVQENARFYPPLPDEETDRLMYQLTKVELEKAGYQRYEISNYAQAGYQCQHNLGYWQGVPYLGLGLGASSYKPPHRYRNIDSLADYIDAMEQGKALHIDQQQLSVKEQMQEFMMLGLRVMSGISIVEFEKRFAVALFDIFGEVLNKYLKMGLLRRENDAIMLSEQGIDLSNMVLADFFD